MFKSIKAAAAGLRVGTPHTSMSELAAPKQPQPPAASVPSPAPSVFNVPAAKTLSEAKKTVKSLSEITLGMVNQIQTKSELGDAK